MRIEARVTELRCAVLLGRAWSRRAPLGLPPFFLSFVLSFISFLSFLLSFRPCPSFPSPFSCPSPSSCRKNSFTTLPAPAPTRIFSEESQTSNVMMTAQKNKKKNEHKQKKGVILRGLKRIKCQSLIGQERGRSLHHSRTYHLVRGTRYAVRDEPVQTGEWGVGCTVCISAS